MAGSLSAEDLEKLVARVRAQGAVSLAALKVGKLDEAGQAAARSALMAAGLELTDKQARVPLHQQIERQVTAAGDAGLTLAAATKALKGARTPAEKKTALEQALAAGHVALAIEEGVERLVPMNDDLLSPAELDRLPTIIETIKALVKATKPKAGKPRPTISRARWLAALALDLGQAVVDAVTAPPIPTALLDALVAAPAPTGLVRIPDVVASLETIYDRAELVASLDTLARQGALELRPESGLTPMSADDRARCPIGFDGTPLSYARIKEPPAPERVS